MYRNIQNKFVLDIIGNSYLDTKMLLKDQVYVMHNKHQYDFNLGKIHEFCFIAFLLTYYRKK